MILIGHVIDELRKLPAQSVHCCVSSPPYWGLRAYGTDPQVWCGDPVCEHEWGEEQPRRTRTADDCPNSPKQTVGAAAFDAQESGRCLKCSAWRGELGSEPTPEQFVANIVAVFSEVHRVLRDDGTCWINLGDSYATGAGSAKNPGGRIKPRGGHEGKHHSIDTYPLCQPNRMKIPGLKPKDLCGIPWRVAFALQAAGWYLRSDIIWHKRSPMPESVTDRPTKSHEYVFLLTKQARYFYDRVAVLEKAVCGSRGSQFDAGKTLVNGAGRVQVGPREESEFRNLRSVWSLSNQPYKGAHFATFPPKLVIPCIKAGTSEKGCCPQCGAPWRRLTNSKRVPTRSGNQSKVNAIVLHPDSPYQDQAGVICGNRDPKRHCSVTETAGWEPTCKCGAAETIPCTVLDPFLGSGTTAAVAEYLGRSWVGCELNPKYADLARERIASGYRPPKESKLRKARRAIGQLQGLLFT